MSRAVKLFLHQPLDTNFIKFQIIISHGLTCPTCLCILFVYDIIWQHLVSQCWRPASRETYTQHYPNTQSRILMHNTDVSFRKFGTFVLISSGSGLTILPVYGVTAYKCYPQMRSQGSVKPHFQQTRSSDKNKAVLDTQEVGKCNKNRCTRMTNVISAASVILP